MTSSPTTCTNSYCRDGWIERGDNESGAAPAMPCRVCSPTDPLPSDEATRVASSGDEPTLTAESCIKPSDEAQLDGVIVRLSEEVERLCEELADVRAENQRLRELYENVVGNRERFGWTINHLLECEEALRVAQTDVDVAVAEGDARYNAFIEGLTAKLNAAGVPAVPSWPDAIDWLIERTDAARAEVRAATLREVEALREALRFYSDGFAYLTPEGWRRIWRDGGQVAREALAHFNQEAEPKRPRNHAPWCSVEHKGPCDFNQEAEAGP